MASKYGYQNHWSLEQETWTLLGYVATDSSGDVTNTATSSTAPSDQDSELLFFPKGLSIAKAQTGLYRITLDMPYWKLKYATAQKVVTKPNAMLVGTVDCTGLTLSSLDTTTLKLTPDDHAEVVVTFSTPTSVTDIATQINTAMASATSACTASIINGKYLRIQSGTLGATSTLSCAASSSADTILGISNVAAAGQTLEGTFKVGRYNVRGNTVHTATDDLTAETIDLIYEDGDGVATNVVSSGFFVKIKLKNVNLP